ncbi:hypothetical protein RRG08_041747 [Elysia crispata]|uniref:Uncharacterized protein n=1 Tax=Elysia crispata TaxID=231223 RepID=A0AAE1D816_9GAST|nr:hypothetical protein RRG08_041747 [Elysia crispata]
MECLRTQSSVASRGFPGSPNKKCSENTALPPVIRGTVQCSRAKVWNQHQWTRNGDENKRGFSVGVSRIGNSAHGGKESIVDRRSNSARTRLIRFGSLLAHTACAAHLWWRARDPRFLFYRFATHVFCDPFTGS